MELLALVGEIDLANSDEILASFLTTIDRLPAFERDAMAGLVIDCSAMTFIGSSGLNMLVALHKKTGLPLVLTHLAEHCRLPFVITKLDTVFELR
jgi:anti-anti-sigma factor